MARYRFTQDATPHSTVSLKFGSFSDLTVIRVDDVQNYDYDGTVYTIKRLLCNFNYFYKGTTWGIENGYPLGRWTSGALSVEIEADSSGVSLGRFGVGNTIGRNYMGYSGTSYPGIGVFWGEYNGQEGALFVIVGTNYISEGRATYEAGYFVPNDVLALGDIENPYSPDSPDTQAGDSSGDGGYANGFPVGSPAATSEAKGIVFPFGSGVHCYVITPAQLNEFSRYMWGSAAGVFDEGGLWGKFQNYKFNPIAGILSCHSLPLVLMPVGGGSASISIAGTTLATATGAPCSSQFTTWVSNTVQIPEPWGTFVDYAYATISIYLPFCGIVPIDVSAVVGGSIYVRYYCDVINGNVSAWVVGTDRNGVQQLLKTATGNAAYHIPITGNDNGQGEIIGSIKQAVSSGLSGNVGGMIAAGVNIISGAEQHHTESVGSMNGNAGYCASTEVFLICNWSFPIYTGNYDYIRGRPSEVSGTVGSFSGYGEFEVHADFISGATDEEKREIETLLSGGVYV